MQVDLEGFASNVKLAMGKRDASGLGFTLDELVRKFQEQEETITNYEAMKEGVEIRIAELEQERDEARSAAKWLLEATPYQRVAIDRWPWIAC